MNHEEIHHNYVINPIRIPAIDQLHHQGKVFIEFVYEVIHSYKNNSLLHQRTLISQYQDPEETKIELRRFDRSMLKSQRQTSRIMSSVLPMFRITKGTSLYNEIVDAIVETVSNRGSSRETSALSVCITRQHIMIHCERCLMRDYRLLRLREMALIQRALRESEAERMRQMMVPASESAIKNLLNRVRVEEEEKESTRKRRKSSCRRSDEVGESGYCTVCLETCGIICY